MNYFEFYGIPISFHPDSSLLKEKFYELSKKYHPDFYVHDDPSTQEEVLRLAAINNQAWHTLSDFTRRLAHILDLYQLLKEDGYQLPQEFLIQMMDINEAITEGISQDEQFIAMKNDIQNIEHTLEKELMELTIAFERLSNPEKEQALLKIRDSYYRKNFLLKIKNDLDKVATTPEG